MVKKLSRITLDKDKITVPDATLLFAGLCLEMRPKNINYCRLDLTEKGVHMIVIIDKHLSDEELFRIRKRYGDDGSRIVMDIFRRKQNRNVLWSLKRNMPRLTLYESDVGVAGE